MFRAVYTIIWVHDGSRGFNVLFNFTLISILYHCTISHYLNLLIRLRIDTDGLSVNCCALFKEAHT